MLQVLQLCPIDENFVEQIDTVERFETLVEKEL